MREFCYRTTTINAEILQYKSRFFLIAEQIWFSRGALEKLVREVKNSYPNFKRTTKRCFKL